MKQLRIKHFQELTDDQSQLMFNIQFATDHSNDKSFEGFRKVMHDDDVNLFTKKEWTIHISCPLDMFWYNSDACVDGGKMTAIPHWWRDDLPGHQDEKLHMYYIDVKLVNGDTAIIENAGRLFMTSDDLDTLFDEDEIIDIIRILLPSMLNIVK